MADTYSQSFSVNVHTTVLAIRKEFFIFLSTNFIGATKWQNLFTKILSLNIHMHYSIIPLELNNFKK